VGESIQQNLVSGNNYLDIFEDNIPQTLLCPGIHSVDSTEELDLDNTNLRLEVFKLLRAEGHGRG
jgi:hypothetical protein